MGLGNAFASARLAGTLVAVMLAVLQCQPAGADVSADLILSLRSLHVDRGASAPASLMLANARLLADATLRPAVRFHLDLNRDEPEPAEVYEAYAEWGPEISRGRLGRFVIPFGIHHRSELYYLGLIPDPLIKNYPVEGPHLIESASGVAYVGSKGSWQLEGALFSHRGPGGVIPSGDAGTVRLQWFGGPAILGASLFRERGERGEAGHAGDARFLGLDWRFSRPAWIVRGELVTGWINGATPGGFYVDVFYHPVSLQRITFVSRVEAVYGQPGGGSARRQTVGLKWEFSPGTAVALDQVFGTSYPSREQLGTLIFLWHTFRL